MSGVHQSATTAAGTGMGLAGGGTNVSSGAITSTKACLLSTTFSAVNE